jgi:hypothetical protein
LYCLDLYVSDIKEPSWLPRGSVARLRVLEGAPLPAGNADGDSSSNEDRIPPHAGVTANGILPRAQRRLLGEIDVPQDGSFHLEIPANTPISLQTLDADGMALRTCSWIWAKNHEPRGCIGCHEDGELTPENFFVDAMANPAIQLTLPAAKRRTVDFRRDVMPIIEAKCLGCHDAEGSPPNLAGGLQLAPGVDGRARFNPAYWGLLTPADDNGPDQFRGKYVQPGSARTSSLIWHIFGRNTSRPWDGETASRPCRPIPENKLAPLTNDERRTFVEWIDLGAAWDGIPGPDPLPGGR